jgi:hypothetical protein
MIARSLMNTYIGEITSLIIEGTTEKILQFIMPLKSICNKIAMSKNGF